MTVKFNATLMKQRRSALGITQDQLAAMMHTTRSTISKWENGMRIPCEEQIVSLYECLKIDSYPEEDNHHLQQKTKKTSQNCSDLSEVLMNYTFIAVLSFLSVTIKPIGLLLAIYNLRFFAKTVQQVRLLYLLILVFIVSFIQFTGYWLTFFDLI